MTERTEREFATRRITAGAYLQISNDKRRAWLVEQYEEDGSLERSDGSTITGKWWRTRELRDVSTDGFDVEWTVVHRADDRTIVGVDGDLLARGEYETFAWDWNGPFRTKAEAVDHAAEAVALPRSRQVRA